MIFSYFRTVLTNVEVGVLVTHGYVFKFTKNNMESVPGNYATLNHVLPQKDLLFHQIHSSIYW